MEPLIMLGPILIIVGPTIINGSRAYKSLQLLGTFYSTLYVSGSFN